MRRLNYYDVILDEMFTEWFLYSQSALVVVVLLSLVLVGTGVGSILDVRAGYIPQDPLRDAAEMHFEGMVMLIGGAALLPVSVVIRWYHNR